MSLPSGILGKLYYGSGLQHFSAMSYFSSFVRRGALGKEYNPMSKGLQSCGANTTRLLGFSVPVVVGALLLRALQVDVEESSPDLSAGTGFFFMSPELFKVTKDVE